MAGKRPSDPNGRHVRVYVSLLNSSAWRVLGPSAVKLFMDMRSTVSGTNNGNLSATLTDLKHRGWSSSETLARAIYELRALGFVAVTSEGGLKQGKRVCTLYRFTDLEVYEQPKVGVLASKATHDYLRFETVRDAGMALADGLEKLREAGKQKQLKKNPPVRKSNPSSSKTELEQHFSSSKTEQGRIVPVRKSNTVISAKNSSDAATTKDFAVFGARLDR